MPYKSYPKLIPALTQSQIDRFWDSIDRSPGHGPQGDCWLWTGPYMRKGYGRFSVWGRNLIASRVAYVLTTGVNSELLVLHRCDYPSCVNPEHLFLGTHRDNAIDKTRKGRHPRTQTRRFSDEDHHKIKSLKAEGLNYKEIGRIMNASPEYCSRIVRGLPWASRDVKAFRLAHQHE